MGEDIYPIRYNYASLVRCISGVCGIVSVIYICKWLYKILYINKLLIYIGALTLPIYILHQKSLFIQRVVLVETEHLLLTIAMPIIVIGMSTLIYKTVNKYIKFLLFGEKKWSE